MRENDIQRIRHIKAYCAGSRPDSGSAFCCVPLVSLGESNYTCLISQKYSCFRRGQKLPLVYSRMGHEYRWFVA